ncbi:ornithine carbamoyltransferase, partial [Candidatus Aerophobetes bacterium]|nr:ornithine carbamoyltransferase [Candidatus Aerophobetes bacterium]
MKKDFLSIFELETDEIYSIFNLARELENKVKKGLPLKPYLAGKTVALLFEKPSTRTRVSFEVAIYQLGGHPLFLSQQDIHLGKSESLEDTARALSRYVNAVIIRTFQQEKLERFARASDVPVINALTDLLHPCQALADYYTLWKRGRLSPQLKFSYIGDGNNVCHSLMLGAAKLGIQLVVATPENYRPKSSIMEKIKGKENIKVVKDPQEAVKEADVIYTD